jgi:lysozyme
MKTSPEGRKLLTQREGLKLRAYKCSAGVWTIGVGHTAAAGPPAPKPGMTITREEADAIFIRDLVQFETAVRRAVRVSLTQGQFDALVSFAFNIGIGGFRKSTVVRMLNQGNYRAGADALMMWVKPPEITARRRSERKQFLDATPKNVPQGAPVKFLATSEIADKEDVTLDYLRASGSRVVTAADTVKRAAVTAGVGDALATATEWKGYADQARELSEGVRSGAPWGELAATYGAPLAAGVGMTLAVAIIAWLIWRAAHRIQQARVEDAVYEVEE